MWSRARRTIARSAVIYGQSVDRMSFFPCQLEPTRNLVSTRFGEATSSSSYLFDSLRDVFVVDGSP